MKSKYLAIIAIVLIVAIVIAAYSYKDNIQNYFLSVEDKRKKIITYLTGLTGEEETVKTFTIAAVNRMNNEEIEAVYDAIFNHIIKQKPILQNSDLYTAFNLISNKYNVFS